MRKPMLLTVTALLAVASLGCSEAPVNEMAAAQKAVELADAAKAPQYAQAQMQMARDTLQAAEAKKAEQDSRFSWFRSYDESRKLAARATVLANTAKTAAIDAINVLRDETTAMLEETALALSQAEQMLMTAPVSKGTRADIELMKQDVAALKGVLENAYSDLSRSDFEGAQAKATTIMERCGTIRTAIESAKTKKGSAT